MSRPFPTLYTNRLVLREIVPADAPEVLRIHSDAEHMRWFGADPPTCEADALKLIEVFAGWRRLPTPGTRWGLQLRDDNKLIGSCGLFLWNPTWRKCVIGYELSAQAQGQGFMQEALVSCLAWSFANTNLHRVEAQVHPQNIRSIHLLRRLRFTQEATLCQLAHWGDQFHAMDQFALLRSEWTSSDV